MRIIIHLAKVKKRFLGGAGGCDLRKKEKKGKKEKKEGKGGKKREKERKDKEKSKTMKNGEIYTYLQHIYCIS